MRERRQPLRGRVRVTARSRAAGVRHTVVADNEITDGGRALVGQLLIGSATAAPISHLAVGTDGTEPAPGDTALGAEVASIDRAMITATELAGQIGLRVSAQVSSEINQAISEAALFNAGDHDTGVMYNRVAFATPLPVSSDVDLIFEWDITF
jgi:hypothetical protein